MILIADDSKFMRIYLKQILKKQGYAKFVEANNGEQAIILYHLLKPKLVFLDITMPVIDGLTALQEIMKMNKQAKVIICSALGIIDHKKQALALGAVDFITKPNFESIPAILKKINQMSGDEAQMNRLLKFIKKNPQTSKTKTDEKQGQDTHSQSLLEINQTEQQISEKELQYAIENGNLTIYYQPLVTHEGQIHSAEALIRLLDPVKGMISPRHFIPLAKQTGLINPLTKWVIINVCSQLKAWGENGHAICPISINLSPCVLKNSHFFDFVKEQLDMQQIPAKFLQFEITETSKLPKDETIFDTLNQVRNLGITIALDDFGTGYSSLDYLRTFQVDSLKIDQVFIKDLDAENNKDQAIVSALVDLAKGLELNIVAEGVEKYEQFQFLKQQSYPYMQGNFFSEPVPVTEFEKLLEKGMIKPKGTATKKVFKERRKYFRFDFPHLVQGEMTVIEFNRKKIDLKTAAMLIKDISLGGIKIQSHLSLPVDSNIRFRFIFTVMDETFDKTGKLRWKNKGKANTYIYGVEFEHNQIDEERLAPIINRMTVLRKNQQEITGTPFIYEDASLFFNKDES